MYKNPRLKHVKKIEEVSNRMLMMHRMVDINGEETLLKVQIQSILDQCNLLLETKKKNKQCEHLKKRDAVYLRSYCEAGCDCPNCHRGDGSDRVKDCVYCQLKWKDKGQYNAKRYPKFAKDRKPFKPSPQPEKCCDNGNFDDGHRCLKTPPSPQSEIEPLSLYTAKTEPINLYSVVTKINEVIDQLNKITKTK